jgi:hypothetical protein
MTYSLSSFREPTRRTWLRVVDDADASNADAYDTTIPERKRLVKAATSRPGEEGR